MRSETSTAAGIQSRAVVARIESLPEFAKARTIALYCSLPDEVPTTGMLTRWLGTKRLALPVVVEEEMTFHLYTGPDSLKKGAFGIMEPTEGTAIPPSEIDLVLVPGVAFDLSGGRLGRGGGYYDRYLSRPDATHIYKVGLCPAGRLVEQVPTEPHDIKMNRVIND